MIEGATQADWDYFDLVLGLSADLLPIVADPDAPPSPNSNVKKFGKIPSVYNTVGEAHGLHKWQTREIVPNEIAKWRDDRRLNVGVRARTLRAIDVDVTDPGLAANITEVLGSLPETFRRTRANSPKFLVAFKLPGTHRKRIITTAHGRIEFLADGQQFLLAGTHPSGARYVYTSPTEIPTLSIKEFEALWEKLQAFAVAPSEVRPTVDGDAAVAAVTTIDTVTLADLRDALAYAPLVEEGESNETWSEIGYSLLSLGTTGRDLFAEFSAQHAEFDWFDPEAWSTWWQAHETQTPRSDYRHIFTLARRLGWTAPPATLDQFPLVEPTGCSVTLLPDAARPVTHVPDLVPPAFNLCTDQANANRLNAHFGNRLRSIAGTFYAYSGTHWRKNEGEAARCAANLGAIVKAEAEAARAKANSILEHGSPQMKEKFTEMQASPRPERTTAAKDLRADTEGMDLLATLAKADALEKWQKACEMRSVKRAALEDLRGLLTEDAARLDRQHHLLNCLSGTIDLQTGEQRGHDPEDYITACAPVRYNPAAKCPNFERFLNEILDEERAAFMQRWLGYCITGETREQKIVLHIGEGSNGKGTLVRVLRNVLGSYIDTAAPHLLTSSGAERHSTEIADLFGKRLVVSQESAEGASLREDFVKHASGEDALKARFLYKDFFEFDPTFKLQLLTNNAPVVKGSEWGIWRRLILVKYDHKYGELEDIASGKAERLVDPQLTSKLYAEREGVFAWLVKGAKMWYDGKLQIPDSVRHSSEAYRDSQDRARQFVRDACIIDSKAWSSFTGGDGIYSAYANWCKANGYVPMGVNKFSGELRRTVAGSVLEEQKRKVGNTWRSMNGIRGVRVNTDYDGGGAVITEGYEDLL